jgi:hypothetical protein
MQVRDQQNKTNSLCQIEFIIFAVTAFICGQNQMNSTIKHASGFKFQ